MENPQDHAFTAMLAALAKRNWVIERAARSENEIIAKACPLGTVGDPLNAPDDQFLIVRFSVWGNGDISATNPKERRMTTALYYSAQDWMSALERVYAELRCYAEEELLRQGANASPTAAE